MGGEVKMLPEVPVALKGGLVPLWIYEGDLEPDRVHGWDSENLPQLAAAIALCNAVNSHDSQGIAFWRKWWEDRMAWERDNFMGVEMAGRTYPSWHFLPKRMVFEICHRQGWVELAAEVYSWMMAFLTLATFSSGKQPGREIRDHRVAEAGVTVGDGDFVRWTGNYCAWSGDRADSRNAKDGGKWWGWLTLSTPTLWVNLTLGEPVGECDERTAERECSGKWILETDEGVLRAILAGDYSKGYDYLRGWKPQVPIRVIQSAEGVSTASPVGRYSSTPHLYACCQWHESGIIQGLYADTGWRDASGEVDWIVRGKAWVEEGEDGLVVVCEREDGKYGSPHKMGLPGGERYLDFTWGPEGLDIQIPEQPKPQEPPVEPPVQPPVKPKPPRKDKWWEFL